MHLGKFDILLYIILYKHIQYKSFFRTHTYTRQCVVFHTCKILRRYRYILKKSGTWIRGWINMYTYSYIYHKFITLIPSSTLWFYCVLCGWVSSTLAVFCSCVRGAVESTRLAQHSRATRYETISPHWFGFVTDLVIKNSYHGDCQYYISYLYNQTPTKL